MNPRQIDRFFTILSRELDRPATVILTGAAAGSLMGHVRPSLDIDFALSLGRKGRAPWRRVEVAVDRAIRLTSIQANYAEDIDRWGAVTLLDYKSHARPYRRFGRLNVRILDPVYWSIGKITRYLEPDVRDLVAVFKRQKVSSNRLVTTWARALRKSPPSAALILFRKQAEHFLRRHGPSVWGPAYDPEKTVRRFQKRLGLTREKP